MNADTYQETLAFLAHTPQRIAELLSGLNGESARLRPAADAFSAVEQACHLRDIEQEGYKLRARRILAEDNPQLDDIDGGKLAKERDYQSQDLAEAIKAFAGARKESLAILRNATPAERLRCGHFGGSGQITLAVLVAMMRAHDSEHLTEVEALQIRLAKS
jgi:hypothetical protein